MDVAGAKALSWRLAQQQHWQSASAVRAGIQPAIDPDGYVLESFHDGVRTYGRQRRIEMIDGRPARILCRVTKRLVGDLWHEDMVVERVEIPARSATV